jgi:Mrp family chromosome partitioning ATPase/capsular polysaccharide biosynthesis protein
MTTPRSPLRSPGPGSTGYVRILRDQWPVIAISIVLCVVGGLLGRQVAPTTYTAQSDLLISPIDLADSTYIGINVFRNVSADPTPNDLTLAQYLNTTATAQLVQQRLHLRDSPGTLLGMVTVAPITQTNIVSIRVSNSSARFATLVANGFADATIARRTQQVQSDLTKVTSRLRDQITRGGAGGTTTAQGTALRERLAALRTLVGLPDPTLSILNRAVVPTVANKPSAKLVAVACVLAGLLLGLGIALLIDSFGGKIRREDELLLRDRLPILARIPRLPDATVNEYVAGRGILPPMAWEAYRTLRTNVLRAAEPGVTPVVLVTSAGPGDGKTLTAVNLAVTLAAHDLRVVLVDGDFRRPMIGSFFGLASPRNGFASTFIDGDVKAAMKAVPDIADLRVLLPTLSSLSQIDHLEVDRVGQVFSALRELADVVIVDSAPATEVSDALVLASAADITLVAVRLGFTGRERFDSLRVALAQYGISPSGLVVTLRTPPAFVVDGSTVPVAIDLKPRRGPSKRTTAKKNEETTPWTWTHRWSSRRDSGRQRFVR